MKLGKKLQFSLAAFGVNLIGITLSSWLLFFYSPPVDSGNTVYLDGKLVGILLAIASVWDSIIDPFIGQWSDNTHSKLGRRKPFLLIGAPIEVVALVLLFAPPSPEAVSSSFIAIFLFLMRTIFFTSHSLVCIPYDAMIAEMSSSSEERVQLSGLKNLFGLIGTLVGTLVAGVLYAISPIIMAVIIGVVGLATIYLTVPTLNAKVSVDSAEKTPVFKGIINAFKVKPFLLLALTALIYLFCQTLLMSNNAYVVTSALGQSESAASLYVAGMVIVMMISAVVWAKIGKKVSANKLYRICIIGMGIGAVIAGFTTIIPIPPTIPFIIGMVIIGPFLGGQMVFSFGIMGAVVNYDETLSGKRREALFYGVFSLASGIGSSLAIFVLPLIHEWFGNTQAKSLGTVIPFMVIAIAMALSYLTFKFYNLNDEGKLIEKQKNE